jgi:hypothetical protein
MIMQSSIAQSAMLILTVISLFIQAYANCYLVDLNPRVGRISGGTRISVTIKGKISQNPHLFFGSVSTSIAKVGKGKVLETNLYIGISPKFAPSISSHDNLVISYVSGCSGAFLFQYFNGSYISINMNSTKNINSLGYQEFCFPVTSKSFVYYAEDLNMNIHSTLNANVNISYPAYVVNVNDSLSVCSRTDSELHDVFGEKHPVKLSMSLDQQDYDTFSNPNILMVQKSKIYRAAFLFLGSSSDLGWNYAHYLGSLAASSKFTGI